MTSDELKAKQKAARKAKRIATEHASVLHDLVEDSLPAGYKDLPAISQATYDACVAWEKADAEYQAPEKAMNEG